MNHLTGMDQDTVSDAAPVILIVEDEAGLSRVLGFWLKTEGFVDYLAGSAEEALELLPLVEPDLVISDVWMPGMDGVELTRRIKARLAIPVILMSGRAEPRSHQADRFFA